MSSAAAGSMPARLLLLALAAALATLTLWSMAHGQVGLSLPQVLQALAGRGDETTTRIVTEIRLPRVAAALLGGAALGVAGLVMQALFRNPLADAWSLGLTAGGQMGAALVVVAGGWIGPAAAAAIGVFAGLGLVTGAALGTLAVALAMMAMARRVGTVTLLVAGLMLGFLAQGLISVLLHFTHRTQGRIYAGWNDGTFANMSGADLPWLALPVAFGLVGAVLIAKRLTALMLGETYAASLGTPLVALRRMALAVVILLVAPVVAYCGPVAFIGLIVPHLARAAMRTGDVPRVLPACALIGALLALLGDFIVHLPWDQHWLHLNAILALVGAPMVIGLLLFSAQMRGVSE